MLRDKLHDFVARITAPLEMTANQELSEKKNI